MEKILNCKKCELYQNQKPLMDSAGEADVFLVGLSAKKIGKNGFSPLSEKTTSGKVIKKIEDTCQGIRFYKTNLVKCLPLSENGKIRYPRKEEMDCCFENLVWEISVLKPQIVFLLGEKVYANVGKNLKIEFKKPDDIQFHAIEYDGIWLVPVQHPAYIGVYRKKDEEKYIEDIRQTVLKLLYG